MATNSDYCRDLMNKVVPLIAGEPNSIPVRWESFIRLNIQ